MVCIHRANQTAERKSRVLNHTQSRGSQKKILDMSSTEPSSSLVDVTVELFDGARHRVSLPASATIGSLRRRLPATISASVLCSQGVVLADHAAIAELPLPRVLSAWASRYSKQRSQELADIAAARLDAGRAKREQRQQQLRALSVAMLEFLSHLSWQTWASLAAFGVLLKLAASIELVMPYLFVCTLVFLSKYGFTERRADEESPYTVFNHGYRALPGQMNAQDLQRNLHGM